MQNCTNRYQWNRQSKSPCNKEHGTTKYSTQITTMQIFKAAMTMRKRRFGEFFALMIIISVEIRQQFYVNRASLRCGVGNDDWTVTFKCEIMHLWCVEKPGPDLVKLCSPLENCLNLMPPHPPPTPTLDVPHSSTPQPSDRLRLHVWTHRQQASHDAAVQFNHVFLVHTVVSQMCAVDEPQLHDGGDEQLIDVSRHGVRFVLLS